MKLSVIIPAYNASGTLASCLEGCTRQQRPADEIIVVDDGSADNTAEVAAGYEGVRYVRQANAGPAAARNHGARIATGDVVVFSDADCIPEWKWLARLEKALTADCVAAGGSYGIVNAGTLLPRVIHAEIRARHARLGAEVDFLGSFNVAYRRDAFLAVGGFDEDFRAASGEDNDLAYRLQDAGGTLRFAPEAIVAHYHPKRLGAYLRTQYGHGYWRAKLYAKHPGRARRGDHYAPLGDLLGIPWSLMSSVLIPACIVGLAWTAWALLPVALLVAGHLALHLPMALRLRDHAGWRERLAYPLIAAVRDDARMLGFVRGLVHFVLRRQRRG